MTEGAIQDGRLPEALAHNVFRVDDTDLDQLLVMSLELARRLHFMGLDGATDGTWGRLLEHDETVLIARSQNLDLTRRGAEFLDDFAAARPHKLVHELRALTDWLDDWAKALARADRPWATLMSERAEAVLKTFQGERPLPARANPDSLEHLRSAYFALSEALETMAEATRGVWEESLNSKLHEPAAALLIAFCRLLGEVQGRVNAFADRLTDFYYHDVLRIGAKPPRPDTVHLLFQRDPTYGPKVVVAAGAPFVIQQPNGGPITFVAESDLTVTDVKVEALHTLRLQRDSLISPDSRLGFVTGAKIDRFAADVGGDDEARQISVALLGGDARGAMRQGDDARIGLAISSPVLWLKEGERRITLSLIFDFGAERVSGLLKDLKRACAPDRIERDPDEARAAFSRTLGRLFARWVVPDAGFRRDAVLSVMRLRATRFIDTTAFKVHRGVVDDAADGRFDEERYSPGDPLILLLAEREGDYPEDSRRNLIRDEIIENLFRVALSKADGWHEIYRPVMLEAASAPGLRGRHAMTLVMDLANEDPAIAPCTPEIHGSEWPTAAPIARLMINKHAGIYPYSLLNGAMLRAVEISVDVAGVRDVQAFNQLGPLDPTRPFMPFGPLPNTASYLVLGSPELARKYPTRIEVQPEWSGLPSRGFDIHYAAYDEDYGAGVYSVSTAILRDGLWAVSTARPVRLLREGAPPIGLPITIDPADVRARWRPTPGAFAVSPSARNGLVRLQLATPEGGFGHQAYPGVLTEAVSARVKDKKSRPIPNPPYTPLMERITLSYSAAARLELGATAAARVAEGEAILHLHPLGTEEIHPSGSERQHGLVPDLGRDGNLFIGLSGREAQGVLTLLFDLRRDAAVDALARRKPPPRLEWSWLAGDQWRPLDARRVLSDTTSGFLTSGIVTLDLPPGLTRGARIMPGDLYWLRLSSDAPSGCFAGLKGVRAQALRAVRVLDETPPATPLPAGSITLNSATLPGVLALRQPEPGFEMRPLESQALYRARVGERLRHKHRAATAWDYERLVLERFPYVHKVRCLANRRDDQRQASPGHVLVVAMPVVPRNESRYATRPMRLDPLQLAEIQDYLSGLASPGIQLKVRNASYDLIQVRCRLTLCERTDAGDALRRINAGIIAYLSPWHDAGRAAQFDWQVRAEEIEACILAVRDVQQVRAISLIHVWEDHALVVRPPFRFRDTAALPDGPAQVGHLQPWSLALPMDEHFIEIDADRADGPSPTGVIRGARAEEPAGFAGIQLGRTAVLGRRDRPLVTDRQT